MPSYKYAQESFTPSVSFDVDNSFGDVEFFGNLMQYKELKKPFWWSIGTGGSVPGWVICSEGVAYFGSCDKNFYAVDAKTGEERWRFSTEGVIAHGCCIEGDTLFFGSYDHNLYALNKETGELKWRFKTNSIIPVRPSVYDGRVYLGAMDGNLYVIDAETGRLVWKRTTNGPLYTPLVADGRIFVGLNNFYAFDLNGRLLWRFDNPSEFMAFPAGYDSGMLFFGCFDSNFYALRGEDGRVKWSFKAGDGTYTGFVWKNRVFFGSRDCCMYCLNKDTGSLIWKFRTNGFVVRPIICNNIAYFGSYDNNIYAVDAETGRLVWVFKTNGIVNYVNAYEGRLYFGCWDCNVYCVDIETGKEIWRFKTSMSSPAKIEAPESSQVKALELTWTPDPEREPERYRRREEGISDYGEFSGAYISKEKSDYIAGRRKGYNK